MSLDLSLHLPRSGFALDVALQLPEQGVSVLWGASGSGKSSVLRCVAGLERAHGHVRLGPTVWQDDARGLWVPPWERRIGLVFQDAHLFEHLDVRGNLHYGLRRLPKAEQPAATAALHDALAVLGLQGLLDRRTATLSGGERQRVAMARALARRPHLLLLDEPLAALDAPRRREVMPWLQALRRHLRLPVLYVTHAADEVAQLADHLVVLDAGRVRASGPVAQVLASAEVPVHLGDDVGALLDAQVQGGDPGFGLCRLQLPGGELWSAARDVHEGQRVRVRLLARDISITLARAEGTSIQNHLPCTVQRLVPDAQSHQVLVQLDACGQTLLARLTARATHQLQLQPGQAVWAQIKAVSLVPTDASPAAV